jgi:hypothetical protein
MLLHVISADNQKDVAETKFLAAVVDGSMIPGDLRTRCTLAISGTAGIAPCS